MLSRAQDARVRESLGSHPTGTLPVYCLEHPWGRGPDPPRTLGGPRGFRPKSSSPRGVPDPLRRGICDMNWHTTTRLLIWGPPSPMMADFRHDTRHGS